LKVASACFQRGCGFLEFKVEGGRKEGVMMCWFFFDIEGPHTSMTVRARLSSNHGGQRDSKVKIHRTDGTDPTVSPRVAIFALGANFN
jgi:hypothetical protein